MALLDKQLGVGIERVIEPDADTALTFHEENLEWEGAHVLPVELVIAPIWNAPTAQLSWDARLLSATLRWQSGAAFHTRYVTNVETGADDLSVPANGLRMRFSARRVTIEARILRASNVLLDTLRVRLAIAPVDSVVHPRPVPSCTGSATVEGIPRLNLFPVGAREFRIWPSDLTLLDDPSATQIVVYYPDGSEAVQTLDLADVADDFCPIAFEGTWWSALDLLGNGIISPLMVEYR